MERRRRRRRRIHDGLGNRRVLRANLCAIHTLIVWNRGKSARFPTLEKELFSFSDLVTGEFLISRYKVMVVTAPQCRATTGTRLQTAPSSQSHPCGSSPPPNSPRTAPEPAP